MLLWVAVLKKTLLHPITFCILYFCFHFSLVILKISLSYTAHWLFRSVLFNLHTFVLFPCGWFLVFIPLLLERMILFQFSWIYWDLFCVPACNLSRRLFHVHLRRMSFLLILRGMFCIYLLNLSTLMCHLGPAFPYWFYVWLIHLCK